MSSSSSGGVFSLLPEPSAFSCHSSFNSSSSRASTSGSSFSGSSSKTTSLSNKVRALFRGDSLSLGYISEVFSPSRAVPLRIASFPLGCSSRCEEGGVGGACVFAFWVSISKPIFQRRFVSIEQYNARRLLVPSSCFTTSATTASSSKAVDITSYTLSSTSMLCPLHISRVFI